MHVKDFAGWGDLKQKIDKTSHLPTYNEREIWWCRIGVNVGHEIDGKSEHYTRPVLIVKKFNARIFWGVATTTQIKQDPHYFLIEFKEREQCIMLSHLRLYDSKRLQKMMGTISDDQFDAVRAALKNLI